MIESCNHSPAKLCDSCIQKNHQEALLNAANARADRAEAKLRELTRQFLQERDDAIREGQYYRTQLQTLLVAAKSLRQGVGIFGADINDGAHWAPNHRFSTRYNHLRRTIKDIMEKGEYAAT